MKAGREDREKRRQGEEETEQETGAASAQAANNNVDIGPVRADEADDMLQVMCAAFELPFEVARPIFYADPYFDLDAKRVLRVDGRIVSCLTLSETQCRVGEACAPITGIAGLATLPTYQNRGYAACLLHATIETLHSRNAPLVGLYPFQSEYYARLGWETATQECRWTAPPAALPAYPEAANVICAGSEHLPSIGALYEQTLGSYCLSGAREPKRWQYLFDRMGEKWIYQDQDGVNGYLFCETQPGTVHVHNGETDTPPTLRVLEMCAKTTQARRGLLGHLSGRARWGQIEYVTSWHGLSSMGLLGLPCLSGHEADSVRVETRPALMLRVADFPALLKCLRSNWREFKDTVALTLHDEQRAASITVVVEGKQGTRPTLTLRQDAARSEETNCKPTLLDADTAADEIEGEARVWAKVAVGHIGGEDACSLGLLRPKTPRAAQMAASLFPARAPFLPALDHF